MPSEPENVHFRSSEFLYRNVHYAPGWYFFDEEGDLYGPFTEKAHCERGLQMYIRQLMAGESPTQIYRPDLDPNFRHLFPDPNGEQ